jgi:hypothetical protein
MAFTQTITADATAVSGSISGTTLTVTARTGTIRIRNVLTASGVTTCQILRQLTGTAGSTGTYTISISQTVASFTGGSTSRHLITQATSADTSLAGLVGVTGVTRTVNDTVTGYLTTYNLGFNDLIITNALTIGGTDAPFEMLIAGGNYSFSGSPSNPTQAVVQVNAGGTLTLGATQTGNSVTDGYQNQILIYQPGQGGLAQSGPGAQGFLTINGGTLNWNYGTISCWGAVEFGASSTAANIGVAGKRQKPVLDMSRTRRAGTDPAQNVYCNRAVNVQSLVFIGGLGFATGGPPPTDNTGTAITFGATPTAFNGYEPQFVRAGFFGGGGVPAGTYTFIDYAGAYASTFDVIARVGSSRTINFDFLNNALGTGLVIGVQMAGLVGVFVVRVYQNILVNGFTGGIVCIQASDGAFYQAPVSSGVATISNIFVGSRTQIDNNAQQDWVRYFGDTDTASLNQWAYTRNYGSANLVLRGIGVASTSVLSVADSNVTLSEVDAIAKLASSFTVNTTTNTITVTANSSLDDVYDALKAFKCTNTQVNLQYPSITTQPVNASGSSLVTAMNIVINSGVTLSNGVKFTSLNTSGTFTNDGVLSANVTANITTTGTFSSGVAITGNVAQATPTNLTNVNITGNLTYNTNSSATITLTNCTITGTVSNTGTGSIQVRRSNSTIGTVGANITSVLVTSLTLTGLTDGSQVYIANGSGVQIEYVPYSSTSYGLNTTGSTGTFTYKVARFGFITATGTFTPATASFTFAITLIPDTNVIEPLEVVETYTELNTAQQIYDYISYYNTTNTGIANSIAAVKSPGAIDFLSLNVTLNPSAAAVMTGTTTLIIKSSEFIGEDIYYSTGDFTFGGELFDDITNFDLLSDIDLHGSNTTTLSADTRIRMANLNSELVFIGVSNIDLYSTESDRNNRDNLRMSLTTSPYRFLYGATVNSVLFQTTLYSETTASVQYEYNIPLNSGNNVLALDTTTLLLSINNTLLAEKALVELVKQSTDIIPALL